MSWKEESDKWHKYKKFINDYDYKHIQAAIDKVCMYDEKDVRGMRVKELLEEIKTYGKRE